MRVKDNYVRGFIAGVIGGFVSLIVNVGTSLLGLNTVMWLEIMSLIILGHFPNTIAQYSFALSIQLAFLGILGALFALILPVLSAEHIYFKGITYSAAIWFGLFSLPHVLNFPELKESPLTTAIANLCAAIAWGAALAFVLKWLGNSTNMKNKTNKD